MKLSEKVKVKREEMGLTQAELAKKADLTQATISRIENGEVEQLKSVALRSLARALGTTVDFLVGNMPKMDFDDTLKADEDAKIIFRGYEKLDKEQKEQLKSFVKFLLDQEKKRKK